MSLNAQVNEKESSGSVNATAIVLELSKGFFDAAAKDDVKSMRFCVQQQGVPMTIRDHEDSTAAHIAAKNGKLNTLRYLLNNQPSLLTDVDAEGKTVLHLAVSSGLPKIVKVLLDEQNADLNVRITLPPRNTVIHVAAEEGKERLMDYFFREKNANIELRNDYGETPILLAANNGHSSIVRYLLNKADADPTIIDNDGNSILHAFARTGLSRTMTYMMKKGIYFDVNWRNKLGECALHRAVQFNRLDFVKFLVTEKDADYDIVDNEGRTPLYEAARMGDIDIVKYLVERGANVELKANDGTKAVDVAKSQEISECLRDSQKIRFTGRRGTRSIQPTYFEFSNGNSFKKIDGSRHNESPLIGTRAPFAGINFSQIDNFFVLASVYIGYVKDRRKFMSFQPSEFTSLAIDSAVFNIDQLNVN